MSTRVLVAYERDDGRYDCHEGRGETLIARITSRTPFGGRGHPVDPTPGVQGLTRPGVRRRLRFGHHDLLVFVTPAYETRSFVALPFGLPAAAAGGALVGSHGLVDTVATLGWVRGVRAALAGAVDGGFGVADARSLLRAEADGFEREGRTVHRLP